MALADRSDDFSALTLDPKWREFNAGAAWSVVYGPGGAGGYVDIPVTQGNEAGMFWFSGADGPLLYPRDPTDDSDYIDGDFECIADVEVLDTDGGPYTESDPSSPRIAGIAAHVLPNPTTANPGTDSYTYFHAGAGQAPGNNAGPGPVWEWKFTIDNVTTWGTIVRRGARAEMKLQRIGSTISISIREPDQSTWMVLYRGAHVELSGPLAVGGMAYAQQAAADIRLRIHSITYATPAASKRLMFTETGSQRALAGTFPTTLNLGFSTTTPTRAEGGNDNNVTEVVGGNYSLTSVTYDAANASGDMVIQGPVTLPTPSAAWNQTYAIWRDPSDGAVLCFTPYANALAVDQAITIADDAMTISIN